MEEQQRRRRVASSYHLLQVEQSRRDIYKEMGRVEFISSLQNFQGILCVLKQIYRMN